MSRELIPDSAPNANGTPFLWSVVIPTYNPEADYLEQALRSVLAQDPGRSLMEIVVLDDCSPNGAPAKLVERIAGDRVTVCREPKNLGLAGIFDRCIGQVRGEWVHIMHQDDVIKPGFYEKLKAGTESATAPGLMFCRQEFIDDAGRSRGCSDLEAPGAGCLPDALARLARAQAIQMSAAVVRSSVYRAVGGFRRDLPFTLDWEMWCRIARQFPVWYEPEVLAGYRIHEGAETSRLALAGRDVEDSRKCIGIISGYVKDPETRATVRRQALQRTAMFAVARAESLAQAGRGAAAWRQMAGALKCDFSLRVLKNVLTLVPAATGMTTKRKASPHSHETRD